MFGVERGQLSDVCPLFWQSDTSVATNSWGYTTEQNHRSSTAILHDLINIVSKNGTLLLNIGPRADGTISEGDIAILRSIGRWLKINGEAIYDTRTWKTYGEGPTSVIEGAFTDAKRAAFSARDVRFTTKGDVLYAILLGVPEAGEVVIESLGKQRGLYEGDVQMIEMIGGAAVEWSQGDEGLKVSLPMLADSPALVLKIR